jgi:uncharacterized protein involved in type VI secretion and phage assembly
MLTDPIIDFQLSQLHHVWGKYAGSVVDTDDPEQSGRLQVLCPSILGSTAVWARPCVPYAGPNVGFFFLPPKGANVWIEFEAGNTSRPIWTGCFWAKGELPADATSADIKLIATDQASLKIDDSSGTIEIANASDSQTTWSSVVATEAGMASHTVGASGVVSESATGTGKVEVRDGSVSVNGGALSVM